MNSTVGEPSAAILLYQLTSLSLVLSTFMAIAQAAVISGIAEGADLQPGQKAAGVSESLRDVVQTGMQCHHIPGLSLAVVKDGQVLDMEGYGVKDTDTGELVTPDTKFLLASVTKAFTASLLTHVMTQHKDSFSRQMSTNVKYVLPGIKFNNTLRSTYATLEDLLAHRMGIPRNNLVRLASDYSIDSFASKLRYLKSKGGFRDSFYYSDLMYGLSSHITQTLQGTPWKQQVHDVLFTPLGMANSTFVDDVDFTQDDVATPYLRENQKTVKASVDFIKHWGKNYGSGNIVSTARDMAQWMQMLLAKGRRPGGDSPVLEEEVVEDVFTAQNFLHPSSYAYNYRKPRALHSFTSDNYGLAWRLGYYRGYPMAYHSGSSWGYRAFLSLLPDMQIGVVTLMTGSDSNYKLRTALHTHLLDRALGLEPWVNATNICAFPTDHSASHASGQGIRRKRSTSDDQVVDDDEEAEIEFLAERQTKKRMKRAVPTQPLQSYVGSYQHPAYGTLTVSVNSVTGHLQLVYGIGQWSLTFDSDQSFDGHWMKDPPTISASFTFLSDDANSVYGVVTSFESADPPVFYRN